MVGWEAYLGRKRFPLSELIAEYARRRSFICPVICGPKRVGKSVLAIRCVAQALRLLKAAKSAEEAFEEALKRVAFTPEEVFELIDRGYRVIVWDDAGAWIGTYRWYSEQHHDMLVKFLEYWNVIGTDVYALVMTTPSIMYLPPKVRDDECTVEVHLSIIGSEVRFGRRWRRVMATMYSHRWDVYGRRLKVKEHDAFTALIMLPDPVYREYLKRRERYAKLVGDSLKAELEAAKRVWAG
ncbi:MAG: hypothetical protein DRJ97_06175 [Thermoprotei archaeon]|nr:MAG: hypothetical protein DRJ97_06175 [Thermoprotei archaeon]